MPIEIKQTKRPTKKYPRDTEFTATITVKGQKFEGKGHTKDAAVWHLQRKINGYYFVFTLAEDLCESLGKAMRSEGLLAAAGEESVHIDD